MTAAAQRAATLAATCPGLRLAVADAPIRAVLLDVDGTLYRQGPLRLAMMAELAVVPLLTGGPRVAREVLGTISRYRRVREALRDHVGDEPVGAVEFERVGAELGIAPERVRAIVQHWMHERPLKYLRACARGGLGGFLERLTAADVRVGALSDYPAAAKLAALGVDRHFDFALCTADEAIGRLKPAPDGFVDACRRWSVEPGEVLYVGDRPEVDARGARGAGMHAAIVGGDGRASPDYLTARDFRELSAQLAGGSRP